LKKLCALGVVFLRVSVVEIRLALEMLF